MQQKYPKPQFEQAEVIQLQARFCDGPFSLSPFALHVPCKQIRLSHPNVELHSTWDRGISTSYCAPSESDPLRLPL